MSLKINKLNILPATAMLMLAIPAFAEAKNTSNQPDKSELYHIIRTITSPSADDPVTSDINSKIETSFAKINILDKNCYVPTLKYELSSYNSDNSFCKPNIGISTKHIEAELPIGCYLKTKHWIFEGGADIIGVRHVFNPSYFNTNTPQTEGQRMGELYADLNIGTKYQNNIIGFGLKGFGGIRGYYGKNLSANTNNSAKTILYTAVKAVLNLTPFKNKNFSINAEGIYDSKKDFQYSAGIGYKL